MRPAIKNLNANSDVNIIATATNNFSIELINQIGQNDLHDIQNISKTLVKMLGRQAELTDTSILKYFNQNTIALIARLNKKIIGYIVGVPLEIFESESWSHFDINLDKNNTLYTYSFVFEPNYRQKNGYAKTLKKIYVNLIKKKGFKYITGHVKIGVTNQFNYKVEIVKIFPSWYSQKNPYEYYRREL